MRVAFIDVGRSPMVRLRTGVLIFGAYLAVGACDRLRERDAQSEERHDPPCAISASDRASQITQATKDGFFTTSGDTAGYEEVIRCKPHGSCKAWFDAPGQPFTHRYEFPFRPAEWGDAACVFTEQDMIDRVSSARSAKVQMMKQQHVGFHALDGGDGASK